MKILSQMYLWTRNSPLYLAGNTIRESGSGQGLGIQTTFSLADVLTGLVIIATWRQSSKPWSLTKWLDAAEEPEVHRRMASDIHRDDYNTQNGRYVANIRDRRNKSVVKCRTRDGSY